MNLNIYRTIMRAFDLASECANHPKNGAPHMEIEISTQKGVFTIKRKLMLFVHGIRVQEV